MKRSDVEDNYKIDFERFYKNEEDFNNEVSKIEEKIKKFENYKTKLTQSAQKLYEALEYFFEVQIIVEKICVYASLMYNVNTSDETAKKYRAKTTTLGSLLSAQTKFYEIEILENADKVKTYIEENEKLKFYTHFLQEILDQKENMLSEKEEIMLTELDQISDNAEKVYSTLFYQDLNFGKIKDEDGKSQELTNQNVRKFLKSKDRKLRRKAYLQYSKVFENFENTFASLLNTVLSKDTKKAKLKKYDSVLAMSLDGYKIDKKFIDNYLTTINKNKGLYKKYNNIMKRYFGFSTLYSYDFGYDKTSFNKEYSVEEGLDMLYNAFSVYGDDYVTKLKKIIDNKSVDFLPTDNKSTGAFATNSHIAGCFACVNYQNKLGDISTLAHELGHVMQMELSREVNHPAYADCSFLLVEIASIINEIVFADYVLKNSADRDEKIKILKTLIDTLLANFFLVGGRLELQNYMYDVIAKDEALSANEIKKEYSKIIKKYELNGVKALKENELTWMRVSHYYCLYYNYQYALGVSVACLFANKILENDELEIKRYKEFLINGGKDYPTNTLKNLGIDLNNINIFDSLLKITDKYINELDKLV